MKTTLMFLLLGMVGCATTHSLPAENYGITETRMVCDRDVCTKVTSTYPVHNVPVKTVSSPKVDEPVTEVEAPIHTWMTRDDIESQAYQNLSKAMHDAIFSTGCMCKKGDPLCSCLSGDGPEVKLKP